MPMVCYAANQVSSSVCSLACFANRASSAAFPLASWANLACTDAASDKNQRFAVPPGAAPNKDDKAVPPSQETFPKDDEKRKKRNAPAQCVRKKKTPPSRSHSMSSMRSESKIRERGQAEQERMSM